MYRFNFIDTINDIIIQNARNRLTDVEFIENEVHRFLNSKRRKDMIEGENYFKGKHDILQRERMVIGADGKLEKVDNLPNNRVVDNQYRKMVNQKVNYFESSPTSVGKYHCILLKYMNILSL